MEAQKLSLFVDRCPKTGLYVACAVNHSNMTPPLVAVFDNPDDADDCLADFVDVLRSMGDTVLESSGPGATSFRAKLDRLRRGAV